MKIRLAAIALISAGLPAGAEDIPTGSRTGATDVPNGCAETAATAIISLAHCPSGLGDADLAQAGRAICGSALPCGVWFWEAPAVAPATAPENHDGLTQQEVVSSRGVWVAETGTFMSIAPVPGDE